jgi:hypothetical protein
MQLELLQLLNYRLSDACDRIEAASVNLADLTFPALVQDLDQNGVYVFGTRGHGKWEPTYVGVACSRLFLERLASHFDTRDGAFMNSMLKQLQRNRATASPVPSLRQLAAEVALSGTLVTIRHSDPAGSRSFERVLRHTMPVLNAGKKQGYDPSAEWAQLGGKT